jgi:tRNA A-37 threonylcarbamoyl transferase component Bud32
MDAWIDRREGNWQWKILAEWDFLLGGTAPWSVQRWAAAYRVECVKQGDHRAVYRIETPKGVFYAKHYRAPRWTDPWRNFFRGCPARREFQTLLALSERGVPTLRPIGWAKPVGLPGLWDSLLLTEAIPQAVSLDEYLRTGWPKLPPADQPKITRCLLKQLAGFLARCHQAGILHEDLHTANILVVAEDVLEEAGLGTSTSSVTPHGNSIEGQEEPQGSASVNFRFFLIDVLAVRLGKPPDRQTTLKNLAPLAAAWRDQTTITQRWYFWKHYCQARPEVAFDLRADAERIDRLGWQWRFRLCRHRDRRLLKPKPDLHILKSGGGKIYALADQNLRVLRSWAQAPDRLVEHFLHRAVKLGHHSVLVEADWPPPEEIFHQEALFSASKRVGLVRTPIPGPHFGGASGESAWGGEKEGVSLSTSTFREWHDTSEDGYPPGGSWAPGDFGEVWGEGFPREFRNFPYFGGKYTHPKGYSIECSNPLDSPFLDYMKPSDGGDYDPFIGSTECLPKAPKDMRKEYNASESGPDSGLASVRVALKRIRERVGWGGWLQYFRGTRARRAWWAGHALLHRGIATPQPIALCEPPFQGNPYYSYLVTQWISNAQNLHLWGWQIARLPQADRLRLAAQCAESLGRLIGRLHAHRVRHGDLKMANILVRADGNSLQTWLLDVGRIRIGSRWQRGYRKDLVRLAQGLSAHPWVPRSVLCRFLHTYTKQFPAFARPDWKTLWRQISKELTRWQHKHKGHCPLL